ncbi:hypothetical protein L195_g006583, partial [Trifolium pratense]
SYWTNTHLNEGNNRLVVEKALPLETWVGGSISGGGSLFPNRDRDHLESRMTAKHAGRGTKVGGVMQRQICCGCEKLDRKELLQRGFGD